MLTARAPARQAPGRAGLSLTAIRPKSGAIAADQRGQGLNNAFRGRLTRDGIRIHETEDFAGMHAAGALAARILDDIGAHVGVGQSTGALDRLIQQMVEEAGATSATIGYKGYQHASCISVNHVVCHGIPGNKIPGRANDALKDGDIVNIDVTVIV
ncbi:MAG: M24 family metallopeptidase, partial [Pseudooceanicola sp.]|nr:M24 family metallopeptidase [Pseudooceanicola sp.]